jgi:prepilin-type N-terminal cleavage/methylation domain-containing protein
MTKRSANQRGFGVTELLVVVAIIGIIGAVAAPSLLTYYQSSSLTAGAEQLASVLNRARHLAVRNNASVCVELNGTTVRMRTVSCAGTVWTGVGTDSAGTITIANNLQVGGGPNAVFTNVGGASTTASFTVTDPKTSHSRTVAVTASGQVSIQ